MYAYFFNIIPLFYSNTKKGKWAISLANIADMKRPAELISVPQQTAVAATGIIWSRYSFVITPVNYNLFSVNAFMAVTGCYQLYRKFTHNPSVQSIENK